MKHSKFLAWMLPSLYFGGFLILVELVVRVWGVPEYLIPPPSTVLQELVKHFSVYGYHLAITMGEALLGFVTGNLCAIVFAFLFSRWRPMRQGVYPIIVGMQAVPLVAIAPFILIWFGPGITGKVLMSAMICYFPAAVIATDSFSRVNRDALLLLQSLGADRWKTFRSLQLPSSVPGIMSALQVSATLCTIGAVVAELSGANKGVGYLIVMASYEFKTPTLFAVLSITSLATFLFFKFVQLVGSRYAKRFTFSYAVPVE